MYSDQHICALQPANSYGTGYQGVASQGAQQPQAYGSGNTSYSTDQQQGYSGGQTDYDTTQQVPVLALCALRICLILHPNSPCSNQVCLSYNSLSLADGADSLLKICRLSLIVVVFCCYRVVTEAMIRVTAPLAQVLAHNPMCQLLSQMLLSLCRLSLSRSWPTLWQRSVLQPVTLLNINMVCHGDLLQPYIIQCSSDSF